MDAPFPSRLIVQRAEHNYLGSSLQVAKHLCITAADADKAARRVTNKGRIATLGREIVEAAARKAF